MKYTSVKLPMRLAEMIRESNYYKEYGFTSVSSYVLFATRLGLEKIEKEISGLFNILMKVLIKLKKRQKLTYNPTVEEIRNEWETLADTTKEWINDMLDEDNNGIALKTDYYKSYIDFCKSKNYKTEGIKTFYAKFQRLGAIETRRRLHPKDKNASYCFTGFWFKDTPKEPTKDKKQQIFKQKNE